MKNQKGFSVVEGLLVTIIVLLVGFIGYYVYHTSNKTNSLYDNAAKTSNTTAKVETKSASAAKTSNTATKPANATDDEALIVKTVKAKYADEPNLRVIVSEYKGQFAKGTAGGSESPFLFIAKKQNGAWSVIFAGQELPSTAVGQKYGMPTGWYSTDY